MYLVQIIYANKPILYLNNRFKVSGTNMNRPINLTGFRPTDGRCKVETADLVKRMWAYLMIKDYLNNYAATSQEKYRNKALTLSLEASIKKF